MSKRDGDGRRPGNGPPKWGRVNGNPRRRKPILRSQRQAAKRWRDEGRRRFNGEAEDA